MCETQQVPSSPPEASQAKRSHYIMLTTLVMEEHEIFEYIMDSVYNLLFQSILWRLCGYFEGGRKGSIVWLFPDKMMYEGPESYFAHLIHIKLD